MFRLPSIAGKYHNGCSIFTLDVAESNWLVIFDSRSGDSLESKILRDRLYRSRSSPKCLEAMGGTPPEFPFHLTDVKKTHSSTQQQNNSRRTYGQQNSAQQTSGSQPGYGQNAYTGQEAMTSSASTTSYNQQQAYSQSTNQQSSQASQPVCLSFL